MLISLDYQNNLESKTKHCIFDSYDILMSFVNYVVLTLEEIKQNDNFYLNEINIEHKKYTDFVNDYLNNDKIKFITSEQDKKILVDLKSVFDGKNSYLFKNHEQYLVNCFNLEKINLKKFNSLLKLKLHDNKHFRENYLFKYSDYINSLNHKDLEDLIFSHDEFKNLIKLEVINDGNIKELKSELILITINLLFKSNDYTENVCQSNGNSNSPTIKKLSTFRYCLGFHNLLKSFDESLIEENYKKLFKENIKIKHGLQLIIEKTS